MYAHARLITAVAVVGAAMSGLVIAKAGGEAQAPAAQAPAPAQQPPAGRGAGPQGAAGQPAPERGGQGGRRGGFTQFTRPLASQDVIVRGKSLYEANCASCHQTDLRGSTTAPNLLRSGIALNDQKGELVTASIARHTPAITLGQTDTVAIAEYLHSVLATTGGQGSPPGRNPTNVELNVLVGDAASGQTYFGAACSACHSITGDLKGIGSKYPDARALQNAWVAGSGGRFGGGGRGGGGGAGNPVTVTLADGTKYEGTLIRRDDWLVILTLADGTRKSMARTATMKIDVKDPSDPHKKMVLELDDPTNKKMHDVTAYLWTVK
jgi:mono/diheme cytochrome c family protein